MRSGLYKDLAWLITAFSVSRATESAKAHPWCILSDITGHYTLDEHHTKIQIEDAPPDVPVYQFSDLVKIDHTNIPNCKIALETTYGNWFINYLLLVNPFGTKIDYLDGDITPDRIEKKLLANFHDNVKPGQKEEPDAFYVHEYLKYANAMFFLTGLTQLAVWTATKKTIQPSPGIDKLRNELLVENAGHLEHLETIAGMNKKLGAFDRESMRGDPGYVFLSTDGDKSFDVVRMKKYNMHGAEVGMADNAVKGVLVKNSLYEGWEVDKFPIMNDSSRAGSFNRGFQTQLGGVQVKWILRATSNMNITIDDCGSTMGVEYHITQNNVSKLPGYYVVDENGTTYIKNEAQAGSYLGKVVHRRSPMYCKLTETDFCKACVGSKLAISPEGLSLAASEYGSIIMGIFMKAMHGKKLSTAKMNYKTAIT